MSVIILEWKAADWKLVRDYLGLTSDEVFDETGIDPYCVENHLKTDRFDKSRLAYFYNRLLAEKHSEFRMSLEPPKRRKR